MPLNKGISCKWFFAKEKGWSKPTLGSWTFMKNFEGMTHVKLVMI